MALHLVKGNHMKHTSALTAQQKEELFGSLHKHHIKRMVFSKDYIKEYELLQKQHENAAKFSAHTEQDKLEMTRTIKKHCYDPKTDTIQTHAQPVTQQYKEHRPKKGSPKKYKIGLLRHIAENLLKLHPDSICVFNRDVSHKGTHANDELIVDVFPSSHEKYIGSESSIYPREQAIIIKYEK